MCWLSWNLGASTSCNPQGLSRPVMGLLFYPVIGSLCESSSWCKHIGEGNIFFLCLDQTTIPCSLSLWPADRTTFTVLTHLMRSTNHKHFHIISSILFLLILLDPNNFLSTVFQIHAVSVLSSMWKTEIHIHRKPQPKLYVWMYHIKQKFNPLNAELNPICYLLALLAYHFLHVSRIRIKSLILRPLMSYIYIYMYIWRAYSWCF